MIGGADEDKCANNNVVSVIRNTLPVTTTTTTGIQAIQEQITQANRQLTLARNENNQEMVQLLLNQLQNLSMIETATKQRQQAIDIVNRRENWNMVGDICNRITQLVFTGLSGYVSYLILNLAQNVGSLITGAASGLLSLFAIITIDCISKVVNRISSSIPKMLGGGNLMSSGRDIVEEITVSLNEGIFVTPELNSIMIQLNELGYTTNIIAFVILFIFFNIIAHMVRIFMTSNQFSIGFTGISVGRRQTQQTMPTLQTPPTQTIRNIRETPELEDESKEVAEGYKSGKRRRKSRKRRRKRGRKRKQKKRENINI